MPRVQYEELFILTPDELHCGFGLWQGADVIFFARNVQDGAGNVLQIYLTPTQLDLALHQFILLIKFANPLLESLASEWYAVIHPLVHSQPRFHGLVVQKTIPHGDVGADVVGDRPGHSISRIHHRARDIAKGIYQVVRIKVFCTGPQSIEPHFLGREINRGRQLNQVSERFTGEKGGIHSTHCSTHAEAKEGEFLSMSMAENFLHSTGQVI